MSMTMDFIGMSVNTSFTLSMNELPVDFASPAPWLDLSAAPVSAGVESYAPTLSMDSFTIPIIFSTKFIMVLAVFLK